MDDTVRETNNGEETEVTMNTHPRDWPHFGVGETFVLKGITFRVLRINKSNIVLSPDVKGVVPGHAMWLMTRHNGRK